MGLVRGNSDIASRYNLATNGSFSVNQRGVFVNAYGSINNGDYICDAWTFNDSNVDMITAQNFTNTGFNTLSFKGFGKKNQFFYVISKDTSNVPYDLPRIPLTASINAQVAVGVPMSVSVMPRFHVGSLSGSFVNNVVIKAGGPIGHPVQCVFGQFSKYTNGGYIRVTLLADGEFEIYMNNYRELPGEFINPPEFCPVHLSEDLARCKRYYQVINPDATQMNIASRCEVSTYQARHYFPFPVEMADTPSVSAPNSLVAWQNADGTENATGTKGMVVVADKKGLNVRCFLTGNAPSLKIDCSILSSFVLSV